MNIPKISSETLIGTGIFRGYSASGILIWNDSGYIQMYAALGLIMAILFYSALYVTFYKMINTDLRKEKSWNAKYIFIFFIILVVVEIKEPFIFKYILPAFLLITICLYHKRIVNENERENDKHNCTNI